jgi:hypothetical protein
MDKIHRTIRTSLCKRRKSRKIHEKIMFSDDMVLSHRSFVFYKQKSIDDTQFHDSKLNDILTGPCN